jgi:methyl-accepting chemotaxis protein
MDILFKPADWPIAIKLLIAFLFVALVPLIIAGLLSQNRAREGLLSEAKLNLENTSRRTGTVIDDFLKARITDMQQTATLDQVVRYVDAANNNRSTLGPNNTDQLTTFSILKSKAGSLSTAGDYLLVASKSGQVEITSNNNPNQEGAPIEGEPLNIADKDYFQQAMQGRTYISDPILLTFQERGVNAVFYVSSPVRDTQGTPAGVVVLRINMSTIWQLVNADANAAGSGSYTMLIDDNNNLGIRLADSRTYNRDDAQTAYLFSILRPVDKVDAWKNSGRFPANFDFGKAANPNNMLPNLVDVLNRPTFDRDNPFFTTSFNDGKNNVAAQVAYAPIVTKPRWSYFVVVPEATYAAAANDISSTLLLVIALAVLAVVLLALVLARFLTAPVRRISRVLGRIGIGDFEARVPVRGRDELGRLGESLNAMFDNTLSLIQSREEKEELQDRITNLLQEISTVAEGDLTVQAEVTADITGAIADSFNLMIEELRKTVINIQNATTQVSGYSNQMVSNFQQLDTMSDQQATRVMTVSGSVEDINRSIQQVSDSAERAADVAQEARQNASQGGVAVTQTIGGMNRIRNNVQETAKKIKRLGESSQQIGEIVKLIDDIADQTNMLALNAAIQAAMAGEQGKGFSVVSEEVRRLAERSANATREIAALVKSIQDDTAEAVVAMEESTREVVDGSKVADEAGKALAAIEAVVERLANLITNISTVTRQQASSSNNIAASMAELSKLTQEASQVRDQSAEAVATVARTAEDLRVSVSAFRVARGAAPQEVPAGVAGHLFGEGEGDFETFPMPDFADGALPPSNGVPAGQDYYSYTPSSYQPPEVYQPPAGDGGSEPSFSPTWPASTNVAANSTPANPVEDEALDFDLNALLSDDSIFDSIFDETHRPAQPQLGDEETNKPRPQALG